MKKQGTQTPVLLVMNYRMEDIVGEIAMLLKREDVSFDVATGREEALVKIKTGQYKAVYFPSSELDLLDPTRLPPQQDFDYTGLPPHHSGITKRIASMFETVRVAREKGLGVLVADEGQNPQVSYNLEQLGAVRTHFLGDDAYTQYQKLVQLLK